MTATDKSRHVNRSEQKSTTPNKSVRRGEQAYTEDTWFYEGRKPKVIHGDPTKKLESRFAVCTIQEHCILEIGSDLPYEKAVDLLNKTPGSVIVFTGYEAVPKKPTAKKDDGDLFLYPRKRLADHERTARGERIARFLILAPALMLAALALLALLRSGAGL